ncbi:alpha/beta hydrolase family protein [Georgenia thermotolerans]|uniref:Alpha/beta fold hydrolase n=1 Tax=Georgenia thermotolerans TaxID=527326 RepID=A0A7J5UMH6_9MICO|nr:alpha/beta hydrolase family protein [Georgenia thermotolerans]KAE8763143.1 alpha/beta fold hydrolase [Georgenia thermotolerans]
MTTYAIVHGAGGSGWEWHRVAAELQTRGHHVIAPDLPCEDDDAGLAAYTDTVVDAVEEAGVARDRLVVVGHSLGGFTAPLVAARLGAQHLVLAAAMVPRPGETGSEWWEASGYQAATRAATAGTADDAGGPDGPRATDGEPGTCADDVEPEPGAPADDGEPEPDAWLMETFFHDVDPQLAAEALRRTRDQTMAVMSDPWPLAAWPDVATSYVLFRDDRFFPAAFLRAMVRERLGLTAAEVPGGHCAYLSRPAELAGWLAAAPS